ncbi:MAG: ATP synthase F1 subunit epsilon [Paracoccaceae bacterium]
MAEMMQFDLVSPEHMVASFQASEVEIPGAEGDFCAMPDHAAVVTTMRPGIVKATGKGETREFIVTGGFVEITADATSVLAEVAVPRADVTREMLEGFVREAETAATQASGTLLDAAEKRLADTRVLSDLLGI